MKKRWLIDLQKDCLRVLQTFLSMSALSGLMPGQDLTAGGGAIFADAGVGW
jgi:hypothetical protein